MENDVATVAALRPIRREDWRRIHEWASLEQACRYQPWGPNSIEETRNFVDAAISTTDVSPRKRYVWTAVDQHGSVIGVGEIHHKSIRRKQGEIAYAVHQDLWGHGIGSQIAALLLHFGFESLRLHRIAATCDPRNVGSSRILRKVGMTYEGTLRETIELKDGWRDSEIHSILRHEWRPVADCAQRVRL
jgi:RimJ/RimL family protein N-acetyltransferase